MMETTMEIQKANLEHVSEIVLLNDAVQKMHADQHPEVFKYPTDAAEMEKFFCDVISSDENFIFMARISNRAVGYIWAAVQQKTETIFKYAQKSIHIHQLSVETEYRRRGVGRGLMDAVGNLARENGTNEFLLDSWEFNKEGHRFFEQLGFSCFKINMWRKTA
jgi:ribosomal protein S18 acetylase RimI-like enzyme